MKRYQLYLNPHSVSVIDNYQQITDISRSKVIRYLIDFASEQLITFMKRKEPGKKYFMDSLAGFIDLKTDKKTNFANTVDDVLLQEIHK